MSKTIKPIINLIQISNNPKLFLEETTRIVFDETGKAFASLDSKNSKGITLTFLSAKDKEWLDSVNIEYKETVGCPCCKNCDHEVAIGLIFCEKCKWETPYYHNAWCVFTCNKCKNIIKNKSHNENGFICNDDKCTYEEHKNIEKNNYVDDYESITIKNSSKKNPLILILNHCEFHNKKETEKKDVHKSKKVININCESCNKKNKNVLEMWCSFRCMHCKKWNFNDKHTHNEKLDKALHDQIELLN